MVTFESKCWEGDWQLLLQTGYLEEQIARNDHAFAGRVLLINNVRDPDEVEFYARRLVARRVLTGYHVVDHYAAEALDFFGLSRAALGRGYVYSIAELVGVFLCPTSYLLHFSSDAILETKSAWVPDALAALTAEPRAVVANPTWDGCYREVAAAATGSCGPFLVGDGFSDQCYLVRTADFRARIYGERHCLSERYPAHGGESFEKRVDAWMRNHGKQRLTHRHLAYRHLQNFKRPARLVPRLAVTPPPSSQSLAGKREIAQSSPPRLTTENELPAAAPARQQP